MPRKKTKPSETAIDAATDAAAHAATMEAPAEPTRKAAAAEPRFVPDEVPKNWGPPYKAIFTCTPKGFELGENRRYRQMVFTFKDKPDDSVIAALKESGFTYRAAEKSWTIQADAASRLMSDRLAKEFAGQAQSMSR